MSNSIEELKGLVAGKEGVARTNVFRVILPSIGDTDARTINLLCKNVNMPGKQILTNDRVVGLRREKVANGYAVEELSMTFMVLNDYGIKRYFEQWMELAFNNETYEIGYKRDYQRDIIIQQLRRGFALPVYKTDLNLPSLPSELQNRLPSIGPFDLAQGQFSLDFISPKNVVYEAKLFSAFPTTINAIELNNEMDGVAELTVSLSFTNWQDNGGTTPNSNLGNILLGTLLDRLI